jgi:hydroxyacylglutathione hydrolase
MAAMRLSSPSAGEGKRIMPIEIATGHALEDNALCLVHDKTSGRTISIDAPNADAVSALASSKGWKITDVFITHKHWDHVDGVPGLVAGGARLVAPVMLKEQFPAAAQFAGEGDQVSVGALRFDVWHTPGHCPDHISYLLPAEHCAFVADVMFVMGCGRIMEGSPADLRHSLMRLAALPDETAVYSGHDYSLKNARFAASVEPANAAVAARLAEVKLKAEKGVMQASTTIGAEKATNPFLLAASLEAFAERRQARNSFQ